jgi:hypothetical protein
MDGRLESRPRDGRKPLLGSRTEEEDRNPVIRGKIERDTVARRYTTHSGYWYTLTGIPIKNPLDH